MKKSIPLSILLIGLTAGCSFQKDSDGTTTSELHNPFVVDKWTVQEKAANDTCVVSSGYQGIDVVLTKHHAKHGNTLTGVVESSRKLEPGNFIRLNVAGHYYETYEQQFSGKDSEAIIDDLKTGAKAYVEWNNIQTGNDTIRISTILEPTDFAQRYEQCRKGAPQ